MTTINNYESLIKKVGGIEKAKAIIKCVPDGVDTYCCETGGYFKQLPIMKPCVNCIYLNYLRTAIEHHYYGRSEVEELAAYAELSQEKIEGVTTFDEWWKVNELKYDYVFPASRDAFKAGQKSKQAEIDRLEEWNSNQARSIKTYQGEDEDLKVLLQKLIDDEYTTMRPSMAYEIQKALRGKRE